MNISLCDVDGHSGFPNLALMKLSAWHKAQGDRVKLYDFRTDTPDVIYASKVFTFTKDALFRPDHPAPIRGGTGYKLYEDLPEEIDAMLPDYGLYPKFSYGVGFLSRGCIRKCPWCVVPRKEGAIRRYDDIERIAQDRKRVVLMDNNFLANDTGFVEEQLSKAAKAGLRIDFNQGLDARLINVENAALLAKCKWESFNRYGKRGRPVIRFACDTVSAIEPVESAVKTMRAAGFRGEFSVYVLAKEVDDTLKRIDHLLNMDPKLDPMVMAYRDLEGDGRVTCPEVRHLARWCNRVALRKKCSFREYNVHYRSVRKNAYSMYDFY